MYSVESIPAKGEDMRLEDSLVRTYTQSSNLIIKLVDW